MIGCLSSRYKCGPVSEFQEILFRNMVSAVIVGETGNSLWKATMVRRLGARQAFTPRAGGMVMRAAQSQAPGDQPTFGEGPELSVLRMLGLFDRPFDEKALAALLKTPAIRGLTESLTDLSSTEWRTILARLRRAKLISGEDRHNPGHLDTHPLLREYFGEQLRSQGRDAWKECNRRLYEYYRRRLTLFRHQIGRQFRHSIPRHSGQSSVTAQ